MIDCPDLNDSAFHIALSLRANEALEQGESPIDYWYPDVALGSPLFRHYQHLPHVALAVTQGLLGWLISFTTLYRIALGGLLVLFPLSVYFSLRRLGITPLAAGCSALVAPLLSTPHLYGLGFESYLWGGHGLYAQLFASVLAPLAFAESYRAVRSGRGIWRAALLIAATFLSQLIYGYMVALSTLAFLVTREDRRQRVSRVAVLLVTAFLVGSYFFVPAVRDSDFANHSVWEDQEKWDSLGASSVLTHLVTGDLLDYDRWPVLSILLAVGLMYSFWRGDERLRLVGGLFLAWIVLYFGRTTWGMLVDLLPLGRNVPLHRFIGAVHLFAIPLAGCALALLIRWIGILRSGWKSYMAGAALALVLAPAVHERMNYLKDSRTWKREAQAALAADSDVQPLLTELKRLKGGRVYVGLKNRPEENLSVGTIPLSALCLVEGIDTLGFLWIPITYASDIQVWFDPDNETHCRTFGVRYLVFDANRTPPPFAHPIGGAGRYRIYEVDRAAYFGVADVPFAVPCSKRTVYEVGHAWLRSELPQRGVHPALAIAGRGLGNIPTVALDIDDPVGTLTSATEVPSPAGKIVRATDRWSCEAELDRPAGVIWRSAYHPGLRVTVDGALSEVFPVAPGLAAVRVAAGSHTVRFWYQPATRWPWFLAGLIAVVLAAPMARYAERILARMRWPAPSLPLAGKHVLIVLGLAGLAGRPLLQNKELAGHDAVQYLTQLAEFDHCLRDGQIPPRWAPDLAAGRGEPFFAFYPPLLLTVAELLHVGGLGLIASINLATLALFAMSGVMMYLFARDRWGEGAGLVAATAFLFAPYMMMDLYVRHAFLEVSSFAWMPLVAWGAARGGVVRVSVGTALLLMSHPSIAPFFFPGIMIYAFACKTLRRTIGGLSLGVALAAWHLVPAMLERGYLKLGDVIHSSYLNYANHFAYLDQLIWSPWGYGLSLPGPLDEMSFRMGLPHLAAVIFALATLRSRESRALVVFAAIGAFFATTISKSVWDAFPPLHPVQFPTRALAVTAFASAALAGAVWGRRPWIAVAVFIVFGLPLAMPQGYREDVDDRGFTPQRIAKLNMQPGTLGIFEPKTAIPRPWVPNRVAVVDGDARVVAESFRTDRAFIEVVATAPSLVCVGINHFPGWVASVDDHEVPIELVDGMIAVPVGVGGHVINLRFEATPVRTWMAVVSWAALAVLVGIIVKTRRRVSRGGVTPSEKPSVT